jgi:hypothetical protein
MLKTFQQLNDTDEARVARFFLVHHTKTGGKYQIYHLATLVEASSQPNDCDLPTTPVS